LLRAAFARERENDLKVSRPGLTMIELVIMEGDVPEPDMYGSNDD
jgi:hypothetical protein